MDSQRHWSNWTLPAGRAEWVPVLSTLFCTKVHILCHGTKFWRVSYTNTKTQVEILIKSIPIHHVKTICWIGIFPYTEVSEEWNWFLISGVLCIYSHRKNNCCQKNGNLSHYIMYSLLCALPHLVEHYTIKKRGAVHSSSDRGPRNNLALRRWS